MRIVSHDTTNLRSNQTIKIGGFAEGFNGVMAFTAKIFANVRLTVHIFPLKSPENFSRSFFLFLQLTVQICQFLRLTGKFFTANAETH